MPAFERATLDKETDTQFLKAGTRYFIDSNEADIFQRTPMGGFSDSFLSYFIDKETPEAPTPIAGEYAGIPDEELISLASVIPKDDWREIVRSGRGHVMISFRATKDITIPKALGIHTGYFYVLPSDVSLRAAQRKLYGDIYDDPRGFWEAMASENPTLLKQMMSVAEATRDTVKAITTNTGEIAKSVLIVGGGIVATMVLFKLLKK
jgi:hypothetical protein